MVIQEQRDNKIRRWFSMWLDRQDGGIGELFAPDAVYIESWGPEYHGMEKIKLWFDEWNTRGRVDRWDVRQFFHKEDQTVAEWTFRCTMADGSTQSFDTLHYEVAPISLKSVDAAAGATAIAFEAPQK